MDLTKILIEGSEGVRKTSQWEFSVLGLPISRFRREKGFFL